MAADAQRGEGGRPGPTAQRSFDVGGFDAVSLGGPYDVVVTVGPAPSVRAEGDADEIERMEVKVEDGDLHIGREKRRGWSISWRRRTAAGRPSMSRRRARRAAAIGGSGDMRIDKVEGARSTARSAARATCGSPR